MSSSKFAIIASASVLALAIVGCSDEISFDKSGVPDDGAVRFYVYDGNMPAASRSESDTYLAWEFVSSKLNVTNGDSLYVNVGLTENNSSAHVPETRSVPRRTVDLTSIHVTGYADGSKFMDNVKVSRSESGNYWEPESKYYWPTGDVDFYSIADDDNMGLTHADLEIDHTEQAASFSYSIPSVGDGHDAEHQPDLLMAQATGNRKSGNGKGCPNLQFHHAFACIYVDKGEDLEDYNITQITLKGLHAAGNCIFQGKSTDFPYRWSVTDEATTEYSQVVTTERSVFYVNGGETSALATPFMVIPQEIPADSKLTLEVVINGQTKEIPLAGSFKELKADKVYKIMLSKYAAQYPPVRDPQGMAGNNTVSLTWQYPDPKVLEPFPHVHQIGVYFEVEQWRTVGEQEVEKDSHIFTKEVYWANWAQGKFPSEAKLLDLFADISEGTDENGNKVSIDTKKYDRFKVRIYAAYLNETDPGFENKENIQVHLSTPVSLIIDRVKSKAKVAFFLPHNFDTDCDAPWEQLLDDDDKAAAEWFKETFEDGVFVNADNLADRQKDYKFEVIWFPCGVRLDGDLPSGGDHGAGEYNFWGSKASYIMNKMDLSRTDVAFIDYFLNKTLCTPMGYEFYNNECPDFNFDDNWVENRYGFNKCDNYDVIFKDNVCKWSNMYDDEIIKHYDGGDYVTVEDTNALHDFYLNGGNLLLTSFALQKAEAIGVCFNPGLTMFNEIKQPAVWFINPRMRDDAGGDQSAHPIYKGLFSVDPITFKDVYLSDFIDTDGDGIGDPGANNYKHLHAGRDAVAYFLAGIVGTQMIPLLSNDARSCENNNCIWVGQPVHEWGGTVIGTWGQRDDNYNACIVDFAPKSKDRNNGRCVCIGLGAYEFNNGSAYIPGQEVKNNYQSNVHLMTKNALEYLINGK